MTLLTLLLIPFATALVLLLLGTRNPRAYPAIAIAAVLAGGVLLAHTTHSWSPGDFPSVRIPWLPQLGLDISLWLDGPALFWVWLIYGVGILVLVYSAFYMDPGDAPRRFYAALLLFMGSMLGVVMSRNLLLTFVFWEMTSITSFLLIGHWHHREGARTGAKRALVVTGMGGLGLLAGVILLQLILTPGGTPLVALEYDVLWARADDINAHPAGRVALVLLLLGVFTKSAQFPFHFWLPGAMEAPTPVSAFLHAATMVKAGIFLLGRIYPVFGNDPLWLVLVATAGVATMIVGGYMAILCRDLKQLLAYSTVSQLGLLTAYYGFGYGRLGGADLLTLDLLLVASHALFKGGLFMLCGVIDHGTGTRDWTRLGGLWRKMPVTTILTVLGCLSMAGMPFTLGFVAKKLFFEAGLTLSQEGALYEQALLVAAIVASVFTMAYSLQMAILPFFGRAAEPETVGHAHEGSPGLLAAPALLIGACVLAGIWVPLVERPVSLLVEQTYYGADQPYQIAMFKKADLLFWVSMGIFAVGGPLLFRWATHLDRIQDVLGKPRPFLGAFDRFFNKAVPSVAEGVSSFVAGASLQKNTATVLVAFLALMALPIMGVLGWGPFHPGKGLVASGWHHPIPGFTTDAPHFAFTSPTHWMLAGILAMAVPLALAVVLMREALSRILAASFIGVLVGGLFIVFRAPDLAITQVLVELALLLAFLLLLQRIGDLRRESVPRADAIPAAVIAAAVGGVFALLTLVASTSPERAHPILPGNPTHAAFYLQNSKFPAEAGAHAGYGNNVVNVILVDFRGIDTLGEITVLVVAALGIAVVLGGPRGRRTRPAPPALPDASGVPAVGLEGPPSLIFRKFSLPIGAIALLFAYLLFVAGHNAPGGGFIGGLLAALALVGYAWAYGPDAIRLPRVASPLLVIAAGLAVALASGIAPMLLGLPFMRTGHAEVTLPLMGRFELAWAMIFDLGVFLTVLGITLAILRDFARRPA